LQLTIAKAAAARSDEAISAGHGEEDLAAIYQATRPDNG